MIVELKDGCRYKVMQLKLSSGDLIQVHQVVRIIDPDIHYYEINSPDGETFTLAAPRPIRPDDILGIISAFAQIHKAMTEVAPSVASDTAEVNNSTDASVSDDYVEETEYDLQGVPNHDNLR